ncbi:YheC/YheD family protein [Paenibacillus sp. UMB4589-SE434]|uniref:YheC/YheD family endospore coat-associated protein n=1 Tax=Paenibacillus sp. UMB4589-SE434 TaxID=3046314 RepID=UPI00254B60D2|nr:YheC/YheD family protein [Paenibacillus sp. UMB4589-SE434]MDK8182285.1 YheC/YheD family protein [Paenibacillus sp. UMB4589-SE434]
MNGMEQEQLPIVAILTIDDDNEYFRGNRENFTDLLMTGKELGFNVYIVTVKDLKLNAKRVIGYNYVPESNVWQQGWFPLPHVIYNRIPLREDEMQPSVNSKIKSILAHPTIRMFNPYFFNKWNLFEWLKKSKTTKPYIPSTRKLTTSASLGKMLNRHAYVYLKPETGKAGMGIMTLRVNQAKTLKFRLKIQDRKGSTSYKSAHISKLWSRIRKQAGQSHYIIQQGISLAAINRRPFDLRVLVQKNQMGEWDITGVGARIAGVLSITTHVPRGGSIDDPEKLLTSIFGEEQASQIMTRARNASLVIARQVERGSGHTLGEMSMDLGVDASGGIWFFEANAKPMKFDEPHIRRCSLERIFQYSTYLAKNSG